MDTVILGGVRIGGDVEERVFDLVGVMLLLLVENLGKY